MSSQSKTSALSADLNNFIYGVSKRNFQNAPELTKIGITLLKNYPASRDAVLEYFAMVFREAVNVSVSPPDYENESINSTLESVSMIGPELTSMGESWAPFIAPWCIKLIMDIATDKANLPNATLQNTEPIRVLLDMTTQNLTLLNSEERAKCIDMMLGCRACSWAVGWVGRAEPALVAPRALALGADAARSVLAHLAHHPPALYHVRAALVQLFQDAIRPDSSADKKRDVILYLLNLASKSDIVLKALTQDIEQTLTDGVVSRLSALGWAGAAPLPALVSLLARADVRCLLLLLRHAPSNMFCRQLLEHLLQKLEYDSLFPETCLPLVQSAAEEIDLVREKLLDGNQLERYTLARLLILVSYNYPSEFVSTISYFLQYSRDDTTLALLVRIMAGTITMHVPNDSPDICMDTNRYQNFIKSGFEYAFHEAMLADTQIKKCFVEGELPENKKSYLHYLCLNIITLLRWESTGLVPAVRTSGVAAALAGCAGGAADALRTRAGLQHARRGAAHSGKDDLPACHALAEVLDRMTMRGNSRPPPSVEVILKIVKATVQYFFRCLHIKDVVEKIRGVQRACRLLRKMCIHSKQLARAVAFRDLMETALFREDGLFGGRPAEPLYRSHEDLLQQQNQKHGPITQLTQSHTSVFHAGALGAGRRGAVALDAGALLTHNNELLMAALTCMDGEQGIVESATSIALLLVELISPDVMYNGLPWPDEDFTKQVSIERELHMRSAIWRCGVPRASLRTCARAPPALCLASAPLRAAAAAALHRHAAALHHQCEQSEEMSRERGALIELLETMSLGHLLPHPLSHMLELAPSLTTTEVVQMLRDCLWNYTRDHAPSPASFTCDSKSPFASCRSLLHWRGPTTGPPPAQYTDTLRLIIQKRIATLGHLYPIMFLNLEQET